LKDINWYSRDGNLKNWNDGEKTLSFIIDGHRKEIGWDYDDDNILVIMNFEELGLPFIVPERETQKWIMVLDTNRGFIDSKPLDSDVLYLSPKSIIVLVSKNG
jgi:hypothetical protein